MYPAATMANAQEQFDYITRTVDVTLPEGALRTQLERETPLRVKLGVDPTAPDVTLGWAVVFDLLRRFQEMGHTAVLILGDFTAQVGDPSGKSSTRRRLSDSEVNEHIDAVLPTITSLLLPEKLEIRRNSEWLGAMDMADVLEMTAQVTVSRLMDRDDFSRRWKANESISLIEFMYPLLQGTDSVAIGADVEIGGNDQLLNLLMGRDLQERAGQPGQSVATVPLLVGTDGVHKMSQSLGNYISVRDDANEMFGKTMSIPDESMPQWFRLAAGATSQEIEQVTRGLADGSLHPGETKRRLARAVVSRFHDRDAALDAERSFDTVFRDRGLPDDVPTVPLGGDDPVWLPRALTEAGITASNGEARRLIAQGAVKIDGERVTDEDVDASAIRDRVVQVGKRRFIRFV
ncbi:MAG: tyrosine--tRNA ligase [Acidimicrobiia bacterium]|nr:MAG: tyrosine--tRNA ligase [Acidimicrobiia bacterium]